MSFILWTFNSYTISPPEWDGGERGGGGGGGEGGREGRREREARDTTIWTATG